MHDMGWTTGGAAARAGKPGAAVAPTRNGRRIMLRAGGAFAAACALSALPACERVRGQASGWAGMRVLEVRETQFGRLAVVESGRRRYLAYGPGERLVFQSVVDLDRPHELYAPYMRLMMLGVVYAEPCERIVQIGVGAGNMTGHAIRTLPSAVVDAIDVDPHALELGARYFGLVPDPRLRVHVADGAAWLAASVEQFDCVMLDAYDAVSIPPALMTPAFFATVAARLAPGGVVMQNVYLPNVDEDELLAAMRTAFAQIDAYRAGDSAVLAAYQGAARQRDRLMARAQRLDASLRPVHSFVEQLAFRVSAG